MADPNWLFSSTAQAAAAVFAIIGGFITTRILTLAAERRSLESRWHEWNSRILQLEARKRDLLAKIEAEKLTRASEFICSSVAYETPIPSLDEICDVGDLDDVPREALEREYARFVDERENATRFVAYNLRTIDINEPDALKWIRGITGESSIFHETILQAAYGDGQREIRDSLAKRNPLGALANIGVPFAPHDLARPNTRDELEVLNERLTEIEDSLTNVRAELEASYERAPALVMPPSGWWAIVILTYIGASSVIFPLAFLPSSKEEGWMTPVIVGLFAVGLLALVLYIVHQFASMLRPPKWEEGRKNSIVDGSSS